ncbi:MAG: 1-acyl-sn-glycerol-3-phosphate acyltransferase [Saprospiraceae bacterium]
MLYRLVRPLAALGIKANYQHIFLSNVDRIPKDKPVILAANHPTAFIEPCILACFLDRPLYFLVRGDFFAKPIFSFLLRLLNMLPVFRMRDGGFTKLKNNYATFDACSKALKANKTIMILAEGRTMHEKRLRPIQKGTARIAMVALERFPDLEEIYIIPVGVNYTYAEQSRTTVMIDFGEPLRARDYLEHYQEKPTLAIEQLTADLSQALADRVVIIEKEASEELTEYLLRLHRAENPLPLFPIIKSQSEPLFAEKQIADMVNGFDLEKRQSLEASAKQYFDQLAQSGLVDETVVDPRPYALFTFIFLFLGFFPFLIGYSWNFIPLRIAKYLADTRVKHITFYAPVKLALGIGTYLVWTLIWGAILFINEWYWGFLWLSLAGLLGHFSLYYQEYYQKYSQHRRWKNLNDALKNEIMAARKHLKKKIPRQLTV